MFKDGCKIPKLKSKLKFYEKDYIQTGLKSYSNPRITFDGIDWFLSVGVDVKSRNFKLTDEVLGIDLGLKKLVTCSNGKVYCNNNKSKQIKLLRKRQRRIQRKISRKYELNKQGQKFIKTNNIRKEETKLKKNIIKICNIQRDYFNKVVLDVVRNKPQTVILEDLNVKGMFKNKQSQNLYKKVLYPYLGHY